MSKMTAMEKGVKNMYVAFSRYSKPSVIGLCAQTNLNQLIDPPPTLSDLSKSKVDAEIVVCKTFNVACN